MNYKMMIRIHAWLLILEVAFMVPALVISMYTGDGPAVRGFVWTMVIALGISALMFLLTRHAEHKFYAREGMVTTGMAWITLSLVGCLPFFISGRIPNYIDAFFEIVSGFTTTGASICPDVEALGKGILYWRSFSHWVGGMGILVFYLAIAPADGKNDGSTLHILRAESPGPSVNKMVPRMRDTASILYKLYIVLTVLDIIFLLIGKMPVFDAFCIAYGTAGTGGFSVLNSGCATYTPFAQNVTTVFMLLFGVNFSLYYLIVLKHVSQALHDEELRLYLAIVFTSIVLIAINIFGKTADTSSLMFVGACAGSTGGGIKVSRVLLLWRNLRRNMHSIFHPNEVRVVKMNGSRVDAQTLKNVSSYLAAYVFIVIITFLIISADPGNFDLTTNFSAVMATFNNIGPGLAKVGPTCNFSIYDNLSTFVLSIAMLLGRLEIFPILAIMSPSTHKKA